LNVNSLTFSIAKSLTRKVFPFVKITIDASLFSICQNLNIPLNVSLHESSSYLSSVLETELRINHFIVWKNNTVIATEINIVEKKYVNIDIDSRLG